MEKTRSHEQIVETWVEKLREMNQFDPALRAEVANDLSYGIAKQCGMVDAAGTDLTAVIARRVRAELMKTEIESN
jgi:hypothetical protein